jgi:hypothetical protein
MIAAIWGIYCLEGIQGSIERDQGRNRGHVRLLTCRIDYAGNGDAMASEDLEQ